MSATIKLSLRAFKKSVPHLLNTIDWGKVRSSPDLSSNFTLDVLEPDNIEQMYSDLIKVTEAIALETLPKEHYL